MFAPVRTSDRDKEGGTTYRYNACITTQQQSTLTCNDTLGTNMPQVIIQGRNIHDKRISLLSWCMQFLHCQYYRNNSCDIHFKWNCIFHNKADLFWKIFSQYILCQAVSWFPSNSIGKSIQDMEFNCKAGWIFVTCSFAWMLHWNKLLKECVWGGGRVCGGGVHTCACTHFPVNC